MARGQLTGFVAPAKKSGGSEADTTNFIDVVVKSSINRNTSAGEVRNAQEADAVIADLKKLPQSIKVQEKILDMENKKLMLNSGLREITSGKDLFDTNLQSTLKAAAQATHTDIQGQLIPTYAQIYTQAAEDYEASLRTSLSQTQSLTPESLAYKKKLDERAAFYNQLANAYIWPGADGKLGEGIDPRSIAVLVDTNPASGKINNIEIVPSSTVPEDYMPTDVKTKVSSTQDAQELPMYLRSFKSVNEDGEPVYSSRLGNKTFVADASTSKEDGTTKGVLRFKAEDQEGRDFWDKLFGRHKGDPDKMSAGKVEDMVMESGLSLSDTATFDGYDIPDGALVKIGSKTFLQPKQGELYEIGGKTQDEKSANLKKLFDYNGLNPADVKTYYATKDYVYSADGNSKVKATVDDAYFKVGNGTAPGAGQTSIMTPPPAAPAPEVQQTQQESFSNAFFGRKNREAGIETPAARTGNDVVEAGKSFFASKVGRGIVDVVSPVGGAINRLFS